MIRNYVSIAIRNLSKNRAFSLINLSGLAIGIAACLLIFQYVAFELSYDRFYFRANDIHRVYLNIYKNGNLESQSARVAPAVGDHFKHEFPSIEQFTRLIILGPAVLTQQNHTTSETDIFLADSSFFEVFPMPLLEGNSQHAFREPYGVVITASIANELFGNEEALGKTIIVNAENFDGTSRAFTVTGVMDDFPENSHLRPDVLISYPTLFEFVGHTFDTSWQWNETYTYFRLNPDADVFELERGFRQVVDRVNRTYLDEHRLEWEYKLQPIKSIHLQSNLQHEVSVNGNLYYIYALGSVGLLIIIIAYVNFVNLITAKAVQRAKEVGIRKVSGAHHGQLILQFFTEAIVINGIALALAIGLQQALLPLFADWFVLHDHALFDGPGELWVLLGCFTVLLVTGSAFYPAFVLSRYKPVHVLKGSFTSGVSTSVMRRAMVVGQFAAALILIALTLAAGNQLKYMNNHPLGFSPERIVAIKAPKAADYGYQNNFETFKARFEGITGINSVAGSGVIPGQEIYWYNDHVTIDDEKTSGIFSLLPVSEGYFDQYDIKIVSGRTFTRHPEGQIVVNESAMRLMGFEDAGQAIGTKTSAGEIVGIARDYHHLSLRHGIDPVLFTNRSQFNYYTVELEGDQPENILKSVKSNYQHLFPGSPYEYFFLDGYFDQQYRTERRFNSLFGAFSSLAILIACLGLFGLSSLAANQRVKEIGIRKVLGATVPQIVLMLSKDFMSLIALASIAALPLAYLAIDYWLEDFAYRIPIDVWLLITPVIVLGMLAFVTIGFQTVRAALTNPARLLRYE